LAGDGRCRSVKGLRVAGITLGAAPVEV